MTAIIVRPLKFTVTASSGWVAANPVTNTNIDHPGLVAKSTGTTATFTVNLGSSQTIDTVALVGSTLPAGATVSVSAGSYSSGNVAAYTGTKDDATTTKTILQFTAVTTNAITVSITAPAAFQFQRLVIGKRVETDGIDQNCEQSFDDQSVIESGPGYTTVEEFAVLTAWRVKMSWIDDTKWRNEFFPLFNRVGASRPVLFIPIADQPARFQHEAVFGRMTGIAKGEHTNSNNWVVSFTITGLAP
ncbi:hypothetical protein [Brevundimonas sp.]|uniref:hypothetical protein n=1 Tax=Brevundimonas sp. TaxID=1871086 RepID=UPI0035AFE1DB